MILGIKALDYADFCEVGKIIKNKEHTSIQGLNQIRLIKARMNRDRSLS
jgi:chromosomal replication initiation ATPase DnaA